MEENLEEEVVTDLNIYPNPVLNKLNISFSSTENEKYNFKIIDVLGNIILNENYTSINGENKEQLNLSYVAKGIYFLRVEKQGKEIKSMRIVVQ